MFRKIGCEEGFQILFLGVGSSLRAGLQSDNLQDFDFDVTSLLEKMSMSRAHLFRKTKALTGDSPGSLIRVIRLKTAASFIEKGDDNITSISLSVGFSNPSYFAQCFREYYGKTPREYKRGANFSDLD